MKQPLIHNYLKLIRALDGRLVRRIRASALARYYYCAIQSYLTISGINTPKPKEKTHPINIGTEMHDAISRARNNSKYETEFWNAISPFVEEFRKEGAVFSRRWENNLVENDETEEEGWLGIAPDEIKVNADHTIDLVEYKTKSSPYVDWIDISPATFQIKIYAWTLEPLLATIGYRIDEAAIIFLTQKGKPIGEYKIVIDYKQIEKEIATVLAEYKKPLNEMIPPRRWKCYNCPTIYKEKCPYGTK